MLKKAWRLRVHHAVPLNDQKRLGITDQDTVIAVVDDTYEGANKKAVEFCKSTFIDSINWQVLPCTEPSIMMVLE